MQEGDFGVFKTSSGVSIKGEVVGEMADLLKIRTEVGFIRMINRNEITSFTQSENSIPDKIIL